MWSKFKETNPNLLGVTQYFMVLEEEVWNLKRAYLETCLCRTCFNRRLFGEGLTVVEKVLEIVFVPPSTQDVDDSAANIQPPDEALQKLYNFCASHMPGKRRVITELVCADKFDDTHIKCL